MDCTKTSYPAPLSGAGFSATAVWRQAGDVKTCSFVLLINFSSGLKVGCSEFPPDRQAAIVTLHNIKNMKNIYYLLIFVLVACKSNNKNNDIFDNFNKELKVELELKEIRNTRLNDYLQNLYIHNPYKFGSCYINGKEVANRTIQILEEYKKFSKKNQIDSAVMILQNHLDWFKNTFPDESFIPEQIKIIEIQIDNIKTTNYMKDNKENYYFSKLSVGLLDLEFETISFIKFDITDAEFTFNRLEPVLVQDKPINQKGSIFSARILLSAVDTTQAFSIVVKNKSESSIIPIVNGAGIYKSMERKNGIKKIKGIYNYKSRNGTLIEYPFDFEYFIE